MKSKVWITGDCHRNFQKIFDFCENNQTTKNDMLIIAGDAGINYYLDSRDKKVKTKLNELPITLVILHGNHEEKAWNCKNYKHNIYKIGKNTIIAWAEPEFPNILFLDDFCMPIINGKKLLCIGGAYSVDKYYRQLMGYHWFKSEQIPKEDMDLYLLELKSQQKKWDYSIHLENKPLFDCVITHTCPMDYEPTEVFLPNIDQSTVDKRTEEFLNNVKNIITYKEWIAGHFHYDCKKEKIRFIYHDFIEL